MFQINKWGKMDTHFFKWDNWLAIWKNYTNHGFICKNEIIKVALKCLKVLLSLTIRQREKS